jgi:hypothetical protein
LPRLARAFWPYVGPLRASCLKRATSEGAKLARFERARLSFSVLAVKCDLNPQCPQKGLAPPQSADETTRFLANLRSCRQGNVLAGQGHLANPMLCLPNGSEID